MKGSVSSSLRSLKGFAVARSIKGAMMRHMTPRFLLWAYMLLLGMTVIVAVASFFMYARLATSTREIADLEAHQMAVETFGTVAQAFADLVKVAVGAVIGALSATLQSVLSAEADGGGEAA